MKNLFLHTKQGFTLMEIMVVIIVIAVLASVAGPMIGTITDQGRASATRAQMANIKSALVAYKGDTGHYPHLGTNALNRASYNSTPYLGANDTNVLVYACALAANMYGIGNTVYEARWKGPYMDSDPSDFMKDAWGSEIIQEIDNKGQVWLHSSGPDAIMDGPCAAIAMDNYTGDDLVLSIAKIGR